MINRNFLVIVIGRVLHIGISLVAVRIFTSMLSTAEIGNVYLIYSITAFFGFILVNPLALYINRKLNQWVEQNHLFDAFFIFNVYLLLVSVMSLALVYFLRQGLGVGNTVELKLLLLFVMLTIYFNTWNQTVIQTLNLLDHRVSFVVFTVLTSALGLGLSMLLVQGSASALWWLSGQLAAQMALALFGFIYLRKLLDSKLDLAYVRSIASADNGRNIMGFVVPLTITTFLIWTQTQSYRLIIENRIGVEFLAQIGLGLSIAGNIACAVESVVQQVYLPPFYREISAADHAGRTFACNRLFHLAIPIYFSLTLFVCCLAPFLVTLLAHGKFGGAFLFVMYGSWIELFRMISVLLSTAAHAEMQTRSLVKPWLIAAILVAVGVYYGSGTAYYRQIVPSVLVISGLVGMFVMYRDMKKIMRIKLGISGIVRSAAISTPFCLALFMYPQRHSIWISFVVTSVLGGYFLVSQYLVYRQTFPKVAESASA